MDLRVSVVLLFFFFTGGNSLKCYKCGSDSKNTCEAKEQTCPAGVSKCGNIIMEKSISKGCAEECDPGTKDLPTGGTVSTHCCDTDLCNAADGVFKGSFLLLFSPLLFYFLFQ
ncbi:prostate stem cell antigen-like [Megalobrama amblycephala]|uniref:prostate stem cell antigen-like n=1 Tax=Megalobrama amblycephala TaxID=75352 RepID=UPI0020144315|nr:prostate stem cell antigen-like [Megalobrama amblycephala]